MITTGAYTVNTDNATEPSNVTHTPQVPVGYLERRKASSGRKPRILSAALGLTLTFLAVFALGTESASANSSSDYCQHGSYTYIGRTLPSGNAANFVLDMYVYKYTSSGWAWTGASRRLYGSPYGYWTDASGKMTNYSYFNVPRNSGYYVIRDHLFSGSIGSWAFVYGYADDFRGATQYCLS